METSTTTAPDDAPRAPLPSSRCAAGWLGRLVHRHRAALARIARREGLAPKEAFELLLGSFFAVVVLTERRGCQGDSERTGGLLRLMTRTLARRQDRTLPAPAAPPPPAARASRHLRLRALSRRAAEAEALLALVRGSMRPDRVARLQRAVVAARLIDDAPDDAAAVLGLAPDERGLLVLWATGELRAGLRACAAAFG
jgi:hypothetical protein